MRVYVFLLLVPVVWLGLHAYLGRRLIGGSSLSGKARAVAWAAIGLAAALPVASMWLTRGAARLPGLEGLALAGFTALGLSSIALTFVLTADLVRLVASGWRRGVLRRRATETVDPARRRFLGNVVNASIVGTTGTLGATAYAQARTTAEVVEVEVPIENLPPALDGFSIVQLSDIHVGPTIKGEHLRAMVERANELDADLVAVTGDLIDGYVEDLAPDVAALGELRGRHGVYFVTGNHEYYWDGPAWCDHVAELGLTVLNNDHRVLDVDGARLLVAGVTDHRADSMVPEHRSDPAAACRGAGSCDVRILLAHQPASVFEASKVGYDLQLSGHTHGGQYFPMNLLVHLVQPYVSGLNRHDNMWVYVSRGTGYWGPPMRLGAPHEITLLRLRRAEPTVS